MKVTVIGAGNMGGSTALGFAGCGAVPASCITVTARHETSLEKFIPCGIRTTTDNRAAVRDADIVFYAVKPWQMEAVLKETAPVLDYDRQVIVSIAPGIKPEQLKEWLEKDRTIPSIAYVIPNTAIEMGESMTYISAVTATDEQVSMLKDQFDRVGRTQVVPLEHMLYGTSLASCGIAYAMRYIRAASEGGVELGFKADEAKRIVMQTMKGAVELLAATGLHPEAAIDLVATPGGVTIKGLNEMEHAGFTSSVIRGLKAGC